MSNKLVYKIIPTHRCSACLPHCASSLSPSLSAWPAACGLLGFCFMRGQAELEFAAIVARLVLLLLLLWLVVASFSFAAINLLLNATIWLPLRRLHSALSAAAFVPVSATVRLSAWSACPRHRHRMQSTYLGWSPSSSSSSCTVFGSSSRGNKNFVKWQ